MKTQAVHTRDRREDRAERQEKLGGACETLPAKTLLDRETTERRRARAHVTTAEAIVLIPPIQDKPSAKTEPRSISFKLNAPEALSVSVAGTFNNWDATSMPLLRKDGPEWHLKTTLLPGEYEYRFIVDGNWQEDPRAAKQVANPYGSQNSVLKVN